MQRAPEICDGNITETGILSNVLADAFQKDPVMNWTIPAPELYEGFFRLIIEQIFFPRGIVHLEQEHRGVGLWLPPGTKFDIPPGLGIISLMTRLLFRKGLGPIRSIRHQAQVFARHQPTEPHFHLLFVGCRQNAQGQGVGSALLKQGTRICDEQRMPAYLESSNELNLPLYQRHGFEIVARERLPRGGPQAWFMWREAR